MDSGKHANRQRPSILRSVINFVIFLAIVAGLSVLLRTFVFESYEIPSGSMEQTILVGDMVFSEKVSYHFHDPQPGDIVTFHDPEVPGRTLIKRCIAVGGQTVEVDDSGVLRIDGVAQSEPYTSGLPSYPLPSTITYPYTVPQGSIWVMGDNRTNSQDSRFFGAIPISSITGRAALIYWPLNQFKVLK